MTHAVVDDWSELQLTQVVKAVVSRLEADTGQTLAQALLEAQNLYVTVMDRLSKTDAASYTKYHWRLDKALKDAGVIFPNKLAGTKATLHSMRKADALAEKYADLLPKTAVPAPVAKPKLYTLEEALEALQPKIKKIVDEQIKLHLATYDMKSLATLPKLAVVPKKVIHVLVVAAQHVQLHDLQRACAQHENTRDLKLHLYRDEGITHLRKLMHLADTTFVLSEHVTVDVFNAVKTFTQTKNVVLSGGFTTLMRKLEEYYAPSERARQHEKLVQKQNVKRK